jgi:5'-3' exonuclease
MRDRRRDRTIDAAGVKEKWGVLPESIPDYLGLVGDAADGFPGLAGWGARSAAAVLARFPHYEAIPAAVGDWHVDVRSAAGLNTALRAGWDEALLYRRLATLRTDVPLPQRDPGELRWRGAHRGPFLTLCEELGARQLAARPHLWQD